jgi:hypothetical protein
MAKWKTFLEAAADVALIGLSNSGVPGVAQGAMIAKTILDKDGNALQLVPPAPGAVDPMTRVDLILAQVEAVSNALKNSGDAPLSSAQKKAIAVQGTAAVLAESFALAGREIQDKALLQEAINDMATAAGIVVEARLKWMKATKVKVED